MPSKTNLPAIKACLFDMDGLLIDSEDIYTICTNEILHEYGKPDLPWNIKSQLQGRPGPSAGKIFHDWAQLPIDHATYLAKIAEHQKRLFPTCKPLPGVPALLQTLAHRTDPPIELALATSSHAKNFQLKTNHLQDLFSVFPATQRVLGDDPRIAPGRGKPAPDIWLVALQTINDKRRHEGGEAIRPEECLVFEDSVPGTESARRAGMQVVWCPHPGLLQEYAGREEQVLAGQMGELKGESAVVGEVGDGWARLVKSLEELPYEEYGIGVKGGSQL